MNSSESCIDSEIEIPEKRIDAQIRAGCFTDLIGVILLLIAYISSWNHDIHMRIGEPVTTYQMPSSQ